MKRIPESRGKDRRNVVKGTGLKTPAHLAKLVERDVTSFMGSKLDKDGREEKVWVDASLIAEKFTIDIQKANRIKAIIDHKLETEGIIQII